jgi:hypothetical protein
MRRDVKSGLLDEPRYTVEHVGGGDYCWLIIDRQDPWPAQIRAFADRYVAEAFAEQLNDRDI